MFYGCVRVPCFRYCNCASASDAMDWRALNVWVDIHNLLSFIWRFSPFDLSMGKDDSNSSRFIFLSFWIIGLWLWKRFVDLEYIFTSYSFQFKLVHISCTCHRSSAAGVILWYCYMVLWARDGIIGCCCPIFTMYFWNYCSVFEVIHVVRVCIWNVSFNCLLFVKPIVILFGT